MLIHHFITVPLHPLLGCTVAYILGIGYEHIYHSNFLLAETIPGRIATIVLFLCTLLLYICFKKKSWALCMICFIVGGVRMHIATTKKAAESALITGGPVDIVAKVCALEQRKSGPFKTKISVAVKTVTRNSATTSVAAHVQLSLLRKPPLEIGDEIRIRNISLKTPQEVSFQTYLFKEGFVATAFIPFLSFELLHHPRWSFSRTCTSAQQSISFKLSRKLSRSASSLFFPLFFGTKTATNSSIRKQHMQWGIVHFLARSGLHIMLLAACWSYMLRLFPVNYFIKQLILLLLVLLYHLLTFPSISFLRALITYVLYKICILHNVSYHPIHILSLTTLGVLLVNPFQLFFLDFQLSFGLTFALAWYNELKLRRQRLESLLS